MGEPPCTERSIRRARVAELARAVLDARIGFVEGARELALLRLDVDPGEEDGNLVAMDAIAAPPTDREVSRESVIQLFAAVAERYGQQE